jgi:transposase
MRTVIGIDVSKASSQVAILVDGQLSQRIKIDNNQIGFQELDHLIQIATGSVEIVFEATGVYSRRLQHFLEQHTYPYCRLNPLAAKKDMDRLRPNKNDINDAIGLAQCQYELNYLRTYVEAPVYQELQIMSRYYQQVNDDLVRGKNRLHKALQMTFPELEGLLSTTSGDQYWTLVAQFPHADLVLQHEVEILATTILSSTKRNMSAKRANDLAIKLFKLAHLTAATVSANSYEVKVIHKLATQLMSLHHEKQEIIDRMVKLCEPLPEYRILMSIPGFAETTSVSLIGELGDIRRFKTANKLNAFIGIDLRFNDSGNYKSSGFITKRGNHLARKILFKAIGNMASSAAHNHPSHINDWYQKRKRSLSSKGTKKITIGAMDRLISTIHHLVLTNQTYDYTVATTHQHN